MMVSEKRHEGLVTYAAILFELAKAGMEVAGGSTIDNAVSLVNMAVISGVDPDDYQDIVKAGASFHGEVVNLLEEQAGH